MRIIRILALAFILMGLGISSMHAQALVKKDFHWLLKTSCGGIYPATDMMAVFTPSGNILHKQEFQIDLDDCLVPDKGVNKVAFITRVNYEGVRYEMIAVEGKVYPDGKVFIVFHTNGAGSITPPNKL